MENTQRLRPTQNTQTNSRNFIKSGELIICTCQGCNRKKNGIEYKIGTKSYYGLMKGSLRNARQHKCWERCYLTLKDILGTRGKNWWVLCGVNLCTNKARLCQVVSESSEDGKKVIYVTPVEDETERVEKLRRDLEELKSSDAHYAELIDKVMCVKSNLSKASSTSKRRKTTTYSQQKKGSSTSQSIEIQSNQERDQERESRNEDTRNLPPQRSKVPSFIPPAQNAPANSDQSIEVQLLTNSTSSLFSTQQKQEQNPHQRQLPTSLPESVPCISQNTSMSFNNPFNTQFRLNLTLIQQREQKRGNNEVAENIPPISQSAPAELIQYIGTPSPSVPISSIPPPLDLQEQIQTTSPKPVYQLGRPEVELPPTLNQIYILPFGSTTIPPLSAPIPMPSPSPQQQLEFINKSF